MHQSLDHPEFFDLNPENQIIVAFKELNLLHNGRCCCRSDGIFIHEIGKEEKYRITVCEFKLKSGELGSDQAILDLGIAKEYMRNYGRNQFLGHTVPIYLRKHGNDTMADFFHRYSNYIDLQQDYLIVFPTSKSFKPERMPGIFGPIEIPKSRDLQKIEMSAEI